MKNKVTEKLLKLIKENPKLEIIPMINYEVVCEDCGYWAGSFGSCDIDEYIYCNEHISFKSDEDYEIVENFVGSEVYEGLNDEELKAMYENLKWKKAIIIYIELPNEDD